MAAREGSPAGGSGGCSGGVVDLAGVHEPVSDFLALSGDSWPVTREAAMKYALSTEQLEAYERDGFVEGIEVLVPAQVERLRAELADIMDPHHPKHALWYEFHLNEAPEESGAVLFHALGAWRISAAFHDLLFHPRLLVPAAQLMGLREGQLRLFHDQTFVKPAHHGSVVCWHQDYSYWTRTTPMNHLTVHIALDPQAAELGNGSLQYVPGSHKWPLLPITSRHFNDMDSVASVLDAAQREQFKHQHTVRLRAGEASLHHPLALHGSLGNSSEAPRRAAVVNLFAHGTMTAVDEPLLDGIPACPKGAVLGGRFFPLLYDGSMLRLAGSA